MYKGRVESAKCVVLKAYFAGIQKNSRIKKCKLIAKVIDNVRTESNINSLFENKQDMFDVAKRLKSSKEIALDTETTSVDPILA